jgi:hypothetical protein
VRRGKWPLAAAEARPTVRLREPAET